MRDAKNNKLNTLQNRYGCFTLNSLFSLRTGDSLDVTKQFSSLELSVSHSTFNVNRFYVLLVVVHVLLLNKLIMLQVILSLLGLHCRKF